MSYAYNIGDGVTVLDPATPDGSAEPVSILDDAIRQIKAYLRDDSARTRFTAVSNTDQNVVGNATPGTKLIFGVQQFQVGTGYNTATGVFTAPYTGCYLCLVSVRIDTVTSSTPTQINDILSINVNGTAVHRFDALMGTNEDGTCRQIAKLLELTAGDTVAIYLTVTIGSGSITRKVTGDMDKTSFGMLKQ